MKFLSLTSALVLITAGSAMAQNVAPGLIDREQVRPSVPQFGAGSEQPVMKSGNIKREAAENPDKVVANIHSINFTGETVVKDEFLQVIAIPYMNRPLTEQDLADLKYEIQKELFNRGYTLVKAVTPPQELVDGVLEVKLVEARVGDVNIVKNDGVAPLVAGAMASRIKTGQVFDERSAESLITDIDKLKNVRAALTLQPGKEFATTDINAVIQEAEAEDRNFVQADNYGSKFTGEYVGSVHLEHSNALNAGETFSVDGRVSDDNLWYVGAGVTTPIGVRNVKFEAYGSYSENQIGDILEPQSIEGQTTRYDVGFSSNVINRRDERLNVKVGLEARDHESTQFGNLTSEDNIRQAYVNGSYFRREQRSIWYGAVRVSQGIDGLGASSDGDPLLTRARGEQDAVIVRPVAFVSVNPTSNGSLRFSATGQLASENLLSSDLFALGGYGSVRGFEPALEVGEAGYQFSVEYAHQIDLHPDWLLSVGPFFDGGSVFNNVANTVADRDLYSVGLGLEAVTSLIPQGDTILRLDYAYPVGDYVQANDVDDSHVYFSLRQDF